MLLAAQSESTAHDDLHVLLSLHAKSLGHATGACVLQAPAPLHELGLVYKAAVQDSAAPQGVAASYTAHPPLPLHRPVVPHELAESDAHFLCGSSAAFATGVHMPSLPASAQDSQAPSQALLQQKPSAQWLLTHSLSAPQMAPGGFGPQPPLIHDLPATH